MRVDITTATACPQTGRDDAGDVLLGMDIRPRHERCSQTARTRWRRSNICPKNGKKRQEISASAKALSDNVCEQGPRVKRLGTTLRTAEKESRPRLTDKGATNAPAPRNRRTGLFK